MEFVPPQSTTYHVVNSNPNCEQAVRAVPFCAWRLGGEYVMELGDLIHDGPVTFQ